MRVFAHRGASRLATENTLEAFVRAADLGADGIELDVQRCATGEVVVFHDADLVRLAGRPERVTGLSLAALRSVRLEGGGGIPTLEEVFDTVPPRLWVNVELKVEDLRPTGLEDAVVRVLRRTGAEGRVILSCFHPAALWRLVRLCPRVPRALLFGHEQARLLRQGWHALATPAGRVHPEHVLLDRARVQRWHRLGRGVYPWTVDDPGRIRDLAGMGCDGVITNRPDLARDALMGLTGASTSRRSSPRR